MDIFSHGFWAGAAYNLAKKSPLKSSLNSDDTMRFFGKKKIDWESSEYQRARFHYLLQILYGESLAVDYCLVMSAFAPTKEASAFLIQQKKEEDAHLELLTDVVSKMARPHEHISSHMTGLHRLMEPALEQKNWPVCILVQNFIVEGLAITLCQQQGKYADDTLHRVFTAIIKDEVRHVAFGVQELKKVLEKDTDGSVRRELVWIQRKALYHAIMLFKDLASDADEIGMEWDDLAEKVVRDHIDRIKQAGFHLPFFDRMSLKGAVAFFSIV